MNERTELLIRDFVDAKLEGAYSVMAMVKQQDGRILVVKDIGEFIVAHWGPKTPRNMELTEGVLEWIEEHDGVDAVEVNIIKQLDEWCGGDRCYDRVARLEVPA